MDVRIAQVCQQRMAELGLENAVLGGARRRCNRSRAKNCEKSKQ